MTSVSSHRIPAVTVTVDVAVFTVRDDRFQILLVNRGNPPFQGAMALPGGFLEAGEDLDAAAQRELAEETGLSPDRAHLEQFRSYGSPGRDPRTRVVTVCYLALLPNPGETVAGGDAADVAWCPVDELLAEPRALAFDHGRIIADAAEHARSRLEHTTIATVFCEPEFTISQLRRVYETVWAKTLDPGNFNRKLTGTADFLVPTGRFANAGGGRPAALYRRGTAKTLQPPLYRPA